MEYNTNRKDMVMPEYGRNIQKLVDFACTIEDKEKRTQTAHYIVNIMSNIIPQSKDQTDYKHKLWDYIHYMSDFKLDVDSPYPVPPKKAEIPAPDLIPYKEDNIQFKYYGRNLENMIKEAGLIEGEEEKEVAARIIANHMKKMYLTWNKEGVTDDIIVQHMAILSDGKLIVDTTKKALANASELIEKPEPNKNYQNKRSKQRTNKRSKSPRSNQRPRKR